MIDSAEATAVRADKSARVDSSLAFAAEIYEPALAMRKPGDTESAAKVQPEIPGKTIAQDQFNLPDLTIIDVSDSNAGKTVEDNNSTREQSIGERRDDLKFPESTIAAWNQAQMTVIGDRLLIDHMAPEERAPFIHDTVLAADALLNAPKEERERILRDFVNESIANYKSVDTAAIGKVLGNALETSYNVEAGPVKVDRIESVIRLTDPLTGDVIARAATPSIFSDYNLKTDEVALDAAGIIVDKMREAVRGSAGGEPSLEDQVEFSIVFDRFLESGKNAGLLAPAPSNLAARERTQDLPSTLEQEMQFVKKFHTDLSHSGNPLELAKIIVGIANEAAFAKPEDQARVLNLGFDAVNKISDNLDQQSLGEQFAFAMNLATQSDDFKSTVEEHLGIISDKSRITDLNRIGSFAAHSLSIGHDDAEQAALDVLQTTVDVTQRHLSPLNASGKLNHEVQDSFVRRLRQMFYPHQVEPL